METFVCHECQSATLPLLRYWSGDVGKLQEERYRQRCTRSPLCGARLTQLAVECVELPDGLLLMLDKRLEEIRFVEG